MGRLYSISFTAVAVTVAQDLFEVLCPADACMILHAISLSQSSDAGDAQSEQLTCLIRRITGSPTSGSGGTTPTPVPLEEGDAAAGITAEVNNNTQLTGGTSTLLWAECYNVMAGFVWAPTPEMRPIFSPSTRLVVELPDAPTDSLTMSGTAIVEEIGG